jgi:septal ring factor EnvC (AmiA/AmiB activator)
LRACGATLLLLAALSAGAAPARPAKPTERSKQKAVVEAERAAVQQKLSALKKSIERTEGEKDEALETLAKSEAAISDANRALRELDAEQAATEVKARQLAGDHQRLSGTVALQQKRLADLLRKQYIAGNEDHIKLLLSGDNPNRINRDLQLMGYVSQAEAKLINSLRANLQAVAANQAETENARDELAEIEQEQREQKGVLEQEKARRAALLAQVSSKLSNQRKQASTLLRDEQQLSALVDRLAQQIEEQRKAEALAAEKRRAEQAEKERLAQAERLRQQQARAEAKAKGKPAPVEKAPPPPVVAAAEPAPLDDLGAFPYTDAAFAAQRGHMTAPARGTLAKTFGVARSGGGPSWKGWFIKADTGADVKAAANGRVSFAGWLRGLGNVLVLNHSDNYISVYSNNETLFKRRGDLVKAGDVVAAAGNTGGNEESGLYFELRFKGKPIDPSGWIKF